MAKSKNKINTKSKSVSKAKVAKKTKTVAKVKTTAAKKAKAKVISASKNKTIKVLKKRSSPSASRSKTKIVNKGSEKKHTKVNSAVESKNAKKTTARKFPRKIKLKFKVGDRVVYPTHGVGLVAGIEQETIAGHHLELVVVTFDNERMTLRVPTEKMDVSGLRGISTQEKMAEAISTLKGRARIKRTMWSRRAQEYEAKINSGDPVAIAKVVRDLYRNVGQPDQSFSERQIYEMALERLAGEVAAIDDTDLEQATVKLEQVLGSS